MDKPAQVVESSELRPRVEVDTMKVAPPGWEKSICAVVPSARTGAGPLVQSSMQRDFRRGCYINRTWAQGYQKPRG